MIIGLLTAFSTNIYGMDYISVDPLWMTAVMDGTKMVNEQYTKQTTQLVEIGALQNTMALHFNAAENW